MHLLNVYYYFIIDMIFTYTNNNNNIVRSSGMDYMDTTWTWIIWICTCVLSRDHVGLSYVQVSSLRWTFSQLFFWRTWTWTWNWIWTFIQLWTCVQVLPILWTPSQCNGIGWHLMMCFQHSLLTFILLPCGLFESVVGSYLQLWTSIVLCLQFRSTCAHPLPTCSKHSVLACCIHGLVCSFRPHPSSILLGSGYTSDDTGDGPPPPLRVWPSHSRSSTAFAWNAIQIDFRRFRGDRIRKILLQFRDKVIGNLFEAHEFIPLWENILFHCNRHDLVDILRKYNDHDWFTRRGLRLLVNTSMDDLLHSWGGAIPTTGTYAPYHQYFKFLESLGPFGDECWITVHSSLFWWFHCDTPMVLLSSSYFLRRWTWMSNCRQGLVVSMRKLLPSKVRVQQFKDVYVSSTRPLLRSVPVPELKFTRNHPSWRAPPPPPRWRVFLRNRLRSMQTFIVPFVLLVPTMLSRSPSPIPQLLFPPPHRHRNKKRKKKRRMDFYRKYFRAPPPPRIHQPPLACILAPDINLNRSSGSFNARDPPD
jgi:hypothetical protein